MDDKKTPKNEFKEELDEKEIDYYVNYDERKQEELINNEGIIRNKLKIKASINNAKIFKNIQKEFGSFKNYLLNFSGKDIIYENDKASSILSDRISNDLIKRGMKYVGTTIIYSYLQAIGIINSHEDDCFYHVNKCQ